ncbi:MAG: DUF4846 domain-containing protein [Bacteroidota bacterium]|nr:DUF4846 domain-containing protein [Bacteroidota bacterium]MDP4247083.1 DUF4846 domain-containing protein [Bacteroidota bacterium]MDP4255038.1 DUF4846 domain-containing protein [Bacteroidota bacterium]MDP4259691.1 DUF4846 domain-containing protein [Bacteroidota bacterium]
MNPNRLIPIILLPAGSVLLLAGNVLLAGHAARQGASSAAHPGYLRVGDIPVPEGYVRVLAAEHSFAAWLRALPLKKDRTVYLYNGESKRNQNAQFAVLDVSVNDPSVRPGHPEGAAVPRDLQQCADAIMRLRAEYLYDQKDFIHIEFHSSQGTRFNFAQWLKERGAAPANEAAIRKNFGKFMEKVFTYCGTLSLERQLVAGGGPEKMEIGDVLIHGGSPGHAMLIIDMAVDGRSGRKVYLLAQGYMPAQDIHIVHDPEDDKLDPWYPADGKTVYTPEYTFYAGQMRAWPR